MAYTTGDPCPLAGVWKTKCHQYKQRFALGDVFPICGTCGGPATWLPPKGLESFVRPPTKRKVGAPGKGGKAGGG
jgi:hypothetical protein